MVKRQLISNEVWEQNYRGPDDNSLKDTWSRQAKAAAAIEKPEVRDEMYEKFLWLLTDFKGIAGGRITANLGIKGREATTLYNCFVHNPGDINYKDPDSIDGIYDMLKAQAQTLKSEGGYGMNFSWIRPRGSYVEGIGGRTPGVLKFMELWDKSSEVITMGCEDIVGERKKDEKKKIRKGAQMGILDCWHPDIEHFITAKSVAEVLTKFNLSVGITHGFMEAVSNDLDWDLEYPITDIPEFKEHWIGDLEEWKRNGYSTTVYKTVKARDLWDKIMKCTYARNEPGVLFLDIMNKKNPLSYAERIKTTNPCGEISMATGVCLLFSLNLVQYIIKDGDGYKFDFDLFKKAVKIAARFADNINDISRTPLTEYSLAIQEKRRIGLGVLGLGSLHYVLGIRFGSEESLQLIKDIFKIKAETEILTSAELGAEKGSFKLFDKEKYFASDWWKNVPISKAIKRKIEAIGEMRNSHHSANAPTGNMSVYAGVVSGGIEPVIWKEYIRWFGVPEYDRYKLKEEGFEFPDIHKGEWFETEYMKFAKAGDEEVLLGSFSDNDYQIDKNRGLTKKILVEDWGWSFVKEHLSKDKIAEYDNNGVFATTDDLTLQEHMSTLKTIAPFVDQNSSKTINLPKNFNYEDFKNVYLDAWSSGIKGITTYRHGTMPAVLEEVKESERKTPARPKSLKSETHKIKLDTGDEVKNAYVTVAFFPDTKNPYEVFINTPVGNNLKDLQILELSARMTSLALRHGVNVQFITDQLMKIDGQYIYSIPNSLAKALQFYAPIEKEIVEEETTKQIDTGAVKRGSKCPQCGAYAYVQKESCGGCLECDYEKCG